MDAMHVHDTRLSSLRTRQRGVGQVFRLIAGYPGLVALGLLGITVGILGCDSGGIGGSGQCGGASDANACVQISTIAPIYLGQTTSNVDAIRDFFISSQAPTNEAFSVPN